MLRQKLYNFRLWGLILSVALFGFLVPETGRLYRVRVLEVKVAEDGQARTVFLVLFVAERAVRKTEEFTLIFHDFGKALFVVRIGFGFGFRGKQKDSGLVRVRMDIYEHLQPSV